MARLLLFHHALGLTEGIRDFAARITEQGHEVITPDLYDGVTFDALHDGVAHAEGLGFLDLVASGEKHAAALPADTVYGGFSLGALVAHNLAQNRAGAAGALLYHHGDVPVAMFGEAWPLGVAVQLHAARGDEFLETPVVEEFVEEVGRVADARLFLYEGSAHLFTDSSLPEFDPTATDLVLQRSLTLLESAG
jgi:dienelactone hydrolase